MVGAEFILSRQQILDWSCHGHCRLEAELLKATTVQSEMQQADMEGEAAKQESIIANHLKSVLSQRLKCFRMVDELLDEFNTNPEKSLSRGPSPASKTELEKNQEMLLIIQNALFQRREEIRLEVAKGVLAVQRNLGHPRLQITTNIRDAGYMKLHKEAIESGEEMSDDDRRRKQQKPAVAMIGCFSKREEEKSWYFGICKSL